MKPHSLVLTFLLGCAPVYCASAPQPRLYIPDGQILGIPVKVYVASTNLDPSMEPRLQLPGYRACSRTNTVDLKSWEPFVVAPNQTWTEIVEDQKVTGQGTLLIFDLNDFELRFPKSTARVTPLLTWEPPGLKAGEPKPVLAGQWFYLGNRRSAGLWAALLIATLVGIIVWMAKKKKPRWLSLLAGEEGYMSLWRTQLAAWTVAVGGMVVMFGFIQLCLPRIPEALVVLMGMSVATGTLSAIAAGSGPAQPDSAQTAQAGAGAPIVPPGTNPSAAGAVGGTQVSAGGQAAHPAATAPTPTSGAGAAAAARTPGPAVPAGKPTSPAVIPRWSDLISAYNPKTGEVLLSVPKAQMVFWTGVILALFVVRSVLSGGLWEVPWELVTLTGVSQAGYLGDKVRLQHGRTG